MKNLQDYCITLETARRLYEAGVTKRTTFYAWDNLSHLRLRTGNEFQLYPALPDGKTVPGDYVAYPALTLQELMEVMPTDMEDEDLVYGLNLNTDGISWFANYSGADSYFGDVFYEDNPLRALEQLALYLLEQGLWPLTH